MKRFSEQLHKKSQTVKLRAVERRELRDRVVSYMEYHPVPGAKQTEISKSVVSPYFIESFIKVPFSQVLKAGTAVAVLLLIIVPTLAERAVPGDGLYAIKVKFNEEVRSTLALTPYQKIEWETQLLNRRIAEARLLASEGRLTNEVEAEVAAAVKTHSENAKREIEVLRTEDEEEATIATIALSTTLEVQATSLAENEESPNESDNNSTTLLASVVKEAASEDPSANPGVPGYEKLMARVESNTTRVHELLASLDLTDSTVDHEDITRRIADIDRTVEDAILQRDMSDESARLMLVDALQRTQKLIVFMTEIQAGQEFEVEDFVPVVLTTDEQTVKIAEYKEDARNQILDIETLLSSSTEAGLAEKTRYTLDILQGLETQMASSTDFIAIESYHNELSSLATDVKRLLDVSQNKTIESVDVETEEATTTEDVDDEATTTEGVIEEESENETSE